MSPGGNSGRTLPRLLTWPVDAAVTVALWTYFTFGFVVLVAPLYLLAAALATDRARACQRLNSLFFRGFFGLCRLLMPRQRWEVDPALEAVSGSVVVCNHLSYLDPLLLIALFPRHTTVVKDRLFRIPVFGAVLRLSGHLASTSLGPEAERTLEQLERLPAFLAGGGNLFVFPEGTRSRDGAVGPLNAGALPLRHLPGQHDHGEASGAVHPGVRPAGLLGQGADDADAGAAGAGGPAGGGGALTTLLPHNLLDLTDLFLDFAGQLFAGTFGFQLRIIAEFPGDLLNLAFRLVKRSFRLVLHARFHGFPSPRILV